MQRFITVYYVFHLVLRHYSFLIMVAMVETLILLEFMELNLAVPQWRLIRKEHQQTHCLLLK